MNMNKSEFLEFSEKITKEINEKQIKTITEKLSAFGDETINHVQLITYAINEAKEFTIEYVNQIILKLLSDSD